MKVLISEKLSEHKYKTPEGYLICTDAILARTGKQSYTKDELFQDGDNTEVNVDRPYDEVMNAKTIASFENKPITFDHPDEDVNVGNYKDYAIGYVRDVHQGKTDKGEDVILGNLVITDQDAINAIEQGDHTDLSCGYDCDIRDDGNGNYSQTNIRGNHLALCEQGRAGIAHIVDSKVIDKKRWEVGYRVRYEGRWYYVIAYSKGDWVLEPENGSRGDYIYVRAEDSKSEDSKMNDKLSYEAASSDDNYLDEVEKMIYKFANVSVDAMLVGDKLKIAAKNSKGFTEAQLQDIVKTLSKYVDVSDITASNPNKFDSQVIARIVDSKARDLVNDSDELVVGRWYEFAKKIEVARNQYAKSLRITGKSGNVYSYTIYLKNGELYDRGTYSEIKERFNIKDSAKDSIMKDESEDWTEMLIKLAVKNGKNSSGDYEYDGDADVNQVRRVLKKLGYKDNGYVKNPKSYLHKLHYYFTDSEILEDMSSDPVVVEDVNYSEKEIKEAAMKLLKQKPFLTYEEALQKVKENIRNGNYLLDNKIEDSMNDAKDSKEMTMSDAIKMLNIVDIYKKVRDSYIVVRNKSKYEDAARKLGLTIEKDSKSLRIYGDKYKLKQLQNQFDNDEEISYVVAKDSISKADLKRGIDIAEDKYGYFDFSQLKEEIEKTTKHQFSTRELYEALKQNSLLNAYINRLFGSIKDEDSTKDGKLWQTLTRKAKH